MTASYMKNQTLKHRGFTLVELLVVISIIGLLSSVVLAALNGARAKGVIASAQTFDDHIYHAFGANAVVLYSLDSLPNSSASDLSGNGNLTLTCSNVSLDANGIKSGAIAFVSNVTNNCSNGSFSFANNKFNPNNGSISFWIKPTSLLSSSGLITLFDNIWVGLNSSGQIYLTQGATLTSNSKLSLNTWSHVLISWCGGSVCSSPSTKIYINGVIDNNSIASLPTFSGNGLFLGGWGANSFDGSLDQFAIYSQSVQSP